MQTATLRAAVAQTALQSLRSALSKDRTDRHHFIVAQTSIVIALALARQAPRGVGNPADWKALPEIFTAAGLKSYAAHCAAFPQALKGRQRSCASWETAQDMATEITVAAFAGCAPRTKSPEQLAAAEAKRAAKKAEREKAEKEAKHAEADKVKQARADAFEQGRASVRLSADAVADAIRAGAFSPAELAVIASALQAAPVDVQAREVSGAGAMALALA